MIAYNSKYLDYIFFLNEKKKYILTSMIIDFSFVKENIKLLKSQEFEFVYVSAKTEGNTYTKAEALTLLERGITANAKPLKDALMLKNLKNAFEEFVLKPKKLDKRILKEIHYVLNEGILNKEDLANFRNKPVAITATEYVPPAFGKEFIESEIDRLIQNSKKIENPFEKAIYLHNNIAYVQPFIDGNKRTARIVQAMVLSSKNITPLFSKEEFIVSYLEGLLSYYESGKYEKYLDYFIQAYKKQYDFLRIFSKEIGNG